MPQLHPLIHNAEREAQKIVRLYQIRKHGPYAWRIWRLYDEWKPIQERASRDDCVDYLVGKLPAIESEM